MRWLLATVLTLVCSFVSADDLFVYRLSGGMTIAVKSGGGFKYQPVRGGDLSAV